VTVPENVDAIHSVILDDRRISARKIAETLAISRERVGDIIHDILDMRKLLKWLPNVPMLFRSMIECSLPKPFWPNFGGIL
jgi:hypothetical protein